MLPAADSPIWDLLKFGAGAVTGLGGAWLSGVLTRRRLLQRSIRAARLELDFIDQRLQRLRFLIGEDSKYAAEAKIVVEPLPRIPAAAIASANAVGAFDHLESTLAELLRGLAAEIEEANDAIANRAQYMVVGEGLYENFHTRRILINNALLKVLERISAKAQAARERIADLNTAQGGKLFLGRL